MHNEHTEPYSVELLWVSACSSANRFLNKNTYTRFTIIWFVSSYGVTARQLQFFRIEKKRQMHFSASRACVSWIFLWLLFTRLFQPFIQFIHTQRNGHPSIHAQSILYLIRRQFYYLNTMCTLHSLLKLSIHYYKIT